jgi:hypothetical protein
VFKRIAPERRAAMGDAGKGWSRSCWSVHRPDGHRLPQRGFVNVWFPPAFMVHIANLLVLIGFWFFALSAIPGTMSARVRHKQLTGVKAWAVGHFW